MNHSILHVLWENHCSWVLGSVGGGLLSILFILLSVSWFRKHRYALGSSFAALELALAFLCCDSWRWALSVSGKRDALLLGIRSYPLLGVFCYCIMLLGAVCIILNICGLIAHGRPPRLSGIPELD